ncbi:MAG: histidine kinase [Mycobacteriaceae bacterium]
MPWSLAVGLVVLGVVSGASGTVMLGSRRATTSAALLIASGVAVVLGVVVDFVDASVPAAPALVAAALLAGLPLAATTYPRWSWRHPVDFVAIAAVAGAGLVAVTQHDTPAIVEPMGFVIVLVLLTHTWWKLETSTGQDRTALMWFAVASGAAAFVAGLVVFASEDHGVRFVVAGLFSVVGPAMAVGVLRPELLDVRGLIVWGVVVFVALTAYLATFVGIVSSLDALGTPSLAPGALGLVGATCALGFHPLMVVMRGVVDQLLFGDRPDPLVAATRVVDRIGADPVLALRAIREALVLPYASLRAEGATLATSGTEVTHTRTLPLRLGGDSVGEVVVGLRAGELGLAAPDEQVLRIVAPLLAQTLRSRALAADLQESRGAAIAAIEDERRRLRRDLHDGLGPTLSGVAFTADAARNHLRTNPARADDLLARLRADTAGAITEIRRLVEGLRPPALDELGLVAAVRQHAASLHTDGGDSLMVTVTAPRAMPELSAATEVAGYRIVVEALTNVARHSTATSARVEVTVDGPALRLEVGDDGRAAADWHPGVGMASMRERAEQVGGTLTAVLGDDGGRVVAVIPL